MACAEKALPGTESGGPLSRCTAPSDKNVFMKEGSSMDLVKILSEQYTKKELPEMNVGDTVRRQP